jgi:hypothetical protein
MNNEHIDLSYSEAYGAYIMEHGSRCVANGEMLLELQESLYLYEEFLASLTA